MASRILLLMPLPQPMHRAEDVLVQTVVNVVETVATVVVAVVAVVAVAIPRTLSKSFYTIRSTGAARPRSFFYNVPLSSSRIRFAMAGGTMVERSSREAAAMRATEP